MPNKQRQRQKRLTKWTLKLCKKRIIDSYFNKHIVFISSCQVQLMSCFVNQSYTHRQSVGKAATFKLFFPSSPRPCPSVEQNLVINVCAHNNNANNREEKCDVTLPWQQNFWITTTGSFCNGDGEQQKSNRFRLAKKNQSRFFVHFLASRCCTTAT